METRWPALPFASATETRETIHRWAQLIGKIQLEWSSPVNHWWNTALRITPRGFATGTMSSDDRWFDLELDFAADVLRARLNDATDIVIPLIGHTVADVYDELLGRLREHGIHCRISPIPAEVADRTRLDRDTRHGYDKPYILAMWRIMSQTAAIMEQVRAGYIGKASPVQLFWGHLDLTMTRFSGRAAPLATGDHIEREAYSHELASVGFWAGDERMTKAAFYAYAYPEPPGLAARKLDIPGVYWERTLRGYYLDYDDVRRRSDPDATIRHFFEAAFATIAEVARWDRAALERPSMEDLSWPSVST